MNTVHNVSTKVNATDKAATETALTINWEGMTPEEIRELARQTIVIKWQSQARKSGQVPTEATIDATSYKPGARAPRQPVSIEALFAAMTPEKKAEFLAMHGG